MNLCERIQLIGLKNKKNCVEVFREYQTIKETANFKGYNPSDNYILRSLEKGYKRKNDKRNEAR